MRRRPRLAWSACAAVACGGLVAAWADERSPDPWAHIRTRPAATAPAASAAPGATVRLLTPTFDDAELSASPSGKSDTTRTVGQFTPTGFHSLTPLVPREGSLTPGAGQETSHPPQHLASSPAVAADPDDELSAVANFASLPPGYKPWWQDLVQAEMRPRGQTQSVQIDAMVCLALQFSPHVQAIKTEPQIRRTFITQECAEFDWLAFLESKYNDVSDPVGNTLQTGGPERYLNQKWTGGAGVRRRNELGGRFEAAQKFGWEDSNSLFFVPGNQGTSRLELNYTQPLLQGAGRPYNESRVVLARLATDAATDEVVIELQDHLLEVTRAYWEVYRTRAVYLQRERLLLSGRTILAILEARQEVDSLQQQILRSRSAVATRQTDLIRAATAVRNAEATLRLLVNEPCLKQSRGVELIPIESPLTYEVPLSMADALQTALMQRPDVLRATRLIKAATTRLGVSENELLPRLDAILSSYVYGLQGNSDIPAAYARQFDAGRPSFSAGLLFEIPIGNRAANARYQQREWELSRAVHEYEATVNTGMTETEVAVREANTAYHEMLGRFQSMHAFEREADYLYDRWEILAGTDRTSADLLEELLMAQLRLAEEEAAFVTAQVNYVIALTNVQRELGNLFKCGSPTAAYVDRGDGGTSRSVETPPPAGTPLPPAALPPEPQPTPVEPAPLPPLLPAPPSAQHPQRSTPW